MWGTSGTCGKKKSLGEYCKNAGGNYDNNNCVTGLCSDVTGKCEIRTSGCRSFSACVGLENAVLALTETFAPVLSSLPGSGKEGDGNSRERTHYVIDKPDSFDLPFEYTHRVMNGITIKVKGGANFPTITPDLDTDWAQLKVVASVGLKMKWSFTITIEGDGNLDLDETKILKLSDSLGPCKPASEECIPFYFFRKPITFKIGPDNFMVFLEAGVQIIAQMKYQVKSNGRFEMKFGLEEQEIDFGTVTISQCGLDKSCTPGISATPPTVENKWIKTMSGEVDSTAEAHLRIGPEIALRINGIGVGAGIMAHMDVQGAISAKTSPSCVAGAGTVAFSLIGGLHVPAFSLGDAIAVQCRSTYKQAAGAQPPSGECQQFGGFFQTMVGELTNGITIFPGVSICTDIQKFTPTPLLLSFSGSIGSGCDVVLTPGKQACEALEFQSSILPPNNNAAGAAVGGAVVITLVFFGGVVAKYYYDKKNT